MKKNIFIELDDEVLKYYLYPCLTIKELDSLQHTSKKLLQNKLIKEIFERYNTLKNLHFYCIKSTRGEWTFPAWVTHGLPFFNNGKIRPKRIFSTEDVKRRLNHLKIDYLFNEIKRSKVRLDYTFTEYGVLWKMYDWHLSTPHLRVIAQQAAQK